MKKLVVGLHGAVCSDCICLCCDIIANEPGSKVQTGRSGYSFEVGPAIARAFPDPAELTEILMILARSVDNRAQMISLDNEATAE